MCKMLWSQKERGCSVESNKKLKEIWILGLSWGQNFSSSKRTRSWRQK